MITGQELPRKVKQALEKGETIVAVIKKIQAGIRAKEDELDELTKGLAVAYNPA